MSTLRKCAECGNPKQSLHALPYERPPVTGFICWRCTFAHHPRHTAWVFLKIAGVAITAFVTSFGPKHQRESLGLTKMVSRHESLDKHPDDGGFLKA